MIRFYPGDIFKSTADFITITVNCVGVMGKGLALQAKNLHPNLFSIYKEMCDKGEIKPGGVYPIKCDDKYFLLFATKDHWRNPSKLEWISSGLEQISKSEKLKSIALPPIGCGNGRLNWYAVLNKILEHLEGSDIDVRIYVSK